jgi:hypothetical protein
MAFTNVSEVPMHIGKSLLRIRLPFPQYILIVCVTFSVFLALATQSPHAAPQTPCPSQADCDRLKAISDLAAAEAAAAKAVADQAEADRQKDLAAANRLESQASHPDPELYPRSYDKVSYGQSMRAQAQGLRDKLANAKANASAKAKTAADAAKAYQDCLDKMKACAPKETTTTPPGAAPTAFPQFGRRAAREGQPTACVDGTTSSTVIQAGPDYLKDNWNGKRFYWDPLDRITRVPPDEPTPEFAKGWKFDATTWTIRPIEPPSIGGTPIYIPPPCYLNPTGGLTIEPGIRYNTPGLTPDNGYFQLPPSLTPKLRFNPPITDTTTNPETPPINRLRLPYLFQPPKVYVRPIQFYDARSQYFWIYDGPGSPHYCAFDFPDALRSFPEVRRALAIEEASRHRRENFPPQEQSRGQLQLASFRGSSPFSELDSRTAPAPQNNASGGQAANPSFTYSIVSNGKSTGEAFQLQLLDTTGKVKSVRMRSGTVVEAIAPGVTQPVTASAGAGGKVVTQPLNGFCLEFAKHPPSEGTLYRLADDSTQQKFRPMRFISRAGDQMQEKKAFHPDSDPKAYTDAILQYALWSKLEGWSQGQFTQHFVERTKQNADALHVKWTSEMENALRAAAPGRWKDISEMLQEATDLEKSSGEGRSGRRGGGRGRGGRRGASRGDQ